LGCTGHGKNGLHFPVRHQTEKQAGGRTVDLWADQDRKRGPLSFSHYFQRVSAANRLWTNDGSRDFQFFDAGAMAHGQGFHRVAWP